MTLSPAGECRGERSWPVLLLWPTVALLAALGLTWPGAGWARQTGPVYEVRLGLFEHDSDFFGDGHEEGLDVNLEVLFRSEVLPFALPQGWPGRLRPMIGVTTQADGETTDQIYGGLTWDFPAAPGHSLRLGFGISAHDGRLDRDGDDDRLALGQRMLWLASFEYAVQLMGPHSVSLYYQHSSNGPLPGPNDGIDNIGVRFGYRWF